MPAPNSAPLVADCQAPATTQSAALQDGATVFIIHAMQKAMLTTAWNTLGLPCAFRHNLLSFMFAER